MLSMLVGVALVTSRSWMTQDDETVMPSLLPDSEQAQADITSPVEPEGLPLAELRRDSSFLAGVALGLYEKRPDVGYETQLREIAELGADTVSLVVTWGQDTVRDTMISPDDEESRDDPAVVEAIRAAHANGLRVLLFPILKIRNREAGEWRGTIEPDDVAAWFVSYTSYIEHYARIAAENGVEYLAIGSELGSMEVHLVQWRALIEHVRAAYEGQLLYSSNWDHYRRTRIWDEVDLVGLTAYYELAHAEDEEVDLPLLMSRWEPIRDEILEFMRTMDKPFVFTELGYYSQRGTAWHPWDYTRRVGVDLSEQYLCYRAFYETWKDVPELGGVFFWQWYGEGGEEDQTYTPRGKPAADMIRFWYGQHSPSAVSGAATETNRGVP